MTDEYGPPCHLCMTDDYGPVTFCAPHFVRQVDRDGTVMAGDGSSSSDDEGMEGGGAAVGHAAAMAMDEDAPPVAHAAAAAVEPAAPLVDEDGFTMVQTGRRRGGRR